LHVLRLRFSAQIDEDTHLTNEPKSIGNGMYLLRNVPSIVSCCPVFQPDRKNLAVHVSLSSNLHNVKDLTPFAALAGGVAGSTSFRIPENKNPSPVARQQVCPFSKR